MKRTTMLTTASLLSIVLLTFHLTDDIVRGMEKGTAADLIAVPIIVLWLYATLVLGERRAGYIIILLLSLLGTYVPWVHFNLTGGATGHGVAGSSGAFFFVWTMIAMGVTSLSAAMLSAYGLWLTFRKVSNR